jgi:RNA polymerase sigma factor (sigma-70 family)
MSVESDRELVAAAMRGDPAAFTALVVRSRGTVESVLERMLPRDEVEDLMQEALLRAYLGLSQLRDPERFASWLCGIAVNLAKMRLRRRAFQPSLIAAGGVSTAAVDLEERELLKVVQDAVALLPPGQRDVVLMHYIDDLSCEEIGRLLGTTPGAVRVRLHRARAQLRRELAPLAPAPFTPTKEELAMTEMNVKDVFVRVATDDPSKPVADQRVVLLEENLGDRLLLIWMGAAEGNALAFRLTGDSPPRPLTSDLMVELLRVTGGRVDRVAITALREKTFYASIVVGVDGRLEELDARPSDAMNLAIRVGAPILVADGVLDEAAVTADSLAEKLECDADGASIEVPPGDWISLSAELLQTLHKPPGK